MPEHKKFVILFTNHYPFSPGEEFLENEIEILSKSFEITVVPLSGKGELRQVPSGVKVELSLSARIERLSNCRTERFVSGLFNLVSSGEKVQSFFPKNIVEMINYSALGKAILDWFEEHYSQDTNRFIMYSYWLTYAAFGIALIKRKFHGLTAISRAHAHDLYEHEDQRRLPYRRFILNWLDRVYCISEDGREYLTRKFPTFNKKVMVSRLGTRDYGLSEIPDSCLKIISCSSISIVKRIDLIVSGLEKFARLNPSKKICWTHIGSGQLMTQIIDKAKILDGRNNVHYKFLGRLDHEEVFSYFKNNPVDFLINTSSSEGLPVSIMEAMSFGIPIIATNVGGTSELVTDKTGVLIPKNCSPEDVSEALTRISKNSRSTDFRIEVRNAWKSKVNAQENFTNFAEQLNSISEQNTD